MSKYGIAIIDVSVLIGTVAAAGLLWKKQLIEKKVMWLALGVALCRSPAPVDLGHGGISGIVEG